MAWTFFFQTPFATGSNNSFCNRQSSMVYPKLVSKATFYLWTALFYSLCLAGLIWQVTQISISFFKYEVTKDIIVVMPNDASSRDKVLFICFFNDRIFDNSRRHSLDPKNHGNHYDEIPLSVRFNMTMDGTELFEFSESVDEFMYSNLYCFQYHFEHWWSTNFGGDIGLRNVDTYWISLGQVSFPYDHNKKVQVHCDKRPYKLAIAIKSSSFSLSKLPWPYEDDCFDYTQVNNSLNRHDAVAKCKSTKKYVPTSRILRKKLHSTSNQTIGQRSQLNKCDKTLFEREDCHQWHHLTQFRYKEKNESWITLERDTDASFKIQSRSKLNRIDFITYILGAMGSWIGFSFVAINPIPFLIKKKDSKVTVTDDGQAIDHLKRQLVMTRQECVQMKLTMAAQNQSFNQAINQQNLVNNQILQRIKNLP